MEHNFCQYALDNGAIIKPLLIDVDDLKGPSLANPSVYVDDDKLYCNLRNLNYVLFHAEKGMFEHQWGKLVYVHKEDDVTLTTHNVFGELDSQLNFVNYSHVDTSELDVPPLWEFVGLEDCRIVKWDNRIYLCGVRRDTTTNGVGRMELSEIVQDNGIWKEVSRFRIPSPSEDSYCEKNWMPIIDQPYRFVKWSNPVEIVEVDPEEQTCETVFVGEHIPGYKDWRGSSQVIPYGEDHYICFVHETDLWYDETERKNARYRSRFLVWDRNWNLVKKSGVFNFLNAEVEFGCGMCSYKGDYIITFSAQDNCSFIMQISGEALGKFIDETA